MRKLIKTLPVSGLAAAIAMSGSYAQVAVAVLVAVLGAMWVLADDRRTARLVTLIRASRYRDLAPETDSSGACRPGPSAEATLPPASSVASV